MDSVLLVEELLRMRPRLTGDICRTGCRDCCAILDFT